MFVWSGMRVQEHRCYLFDRFWVSFEYDNEPEAFKCQAGRCLDFFECSEQNDVYDGTPVWVAFPSCLCFSLVWNSHRLLLAGAI